MRAILILLLIVQPAFARSRWMTFTATAYSVHGTTANGEHTKEGKTVAADPAVIPLGSQIQVKGAGAYSGIYIVQDDGQKIAGRMIDFFIADTAEAKKFGKQTVKVRILKKAPPKPASSQ